jgi:methionine synthase II (cobalamin-independent)
MSVDISKEGIDCSEANELIYNARRAIDQINCDAALEYAVKAENILFDLKREVKPSPYSVEGYLEPNFSIEHRYRPGEPSERIERKPEPPQLQPVPELRLEKPEIGPGVEQEAKPSEETEELIRDVIDQIMKQQEDRERKKRKEEEIKDVFKSIE